MKKSFLAIWKVTTGEEGPQLTDFCLRMSRGDFVEILGTEGAGRKVLVDFFAGKEKILTGFVHLDGRGYGPGETFPAEAVQILSEKPSVAESLTVAENILLLSRNRRVRGVIRQRDLADRASFLLAEFGLAVRASSKVSSLTEGEKRAVELIRAAENDTPFLFLGDIFGTLGREDMRVVEDCLAALKARGHTILVQGEAFPIFPVLDDRVTVMRGGRNVRTFYRGSFDREAYVKWALGIREPSRVRSESVIHLKNRGADGGKDVAFQLLGIRGEWLEEFSLDVIRGEILGLYDMENVNNRELVRIIMGRGKPSGGAMLLNGKPYEPRSVEDAVKNGVGYIPRDIASCATAGNLSYEENLTLGTMKRDCRFGSLVNRRLARYLSHEYGAELNAAAGTEPAAGAQPAAGTPSATGMQLSPGTARSGKDAAKLPGWELDAFDQMRCALQRLLLMRPAVAVLEDVVSDMNLRMLSLQTDYLARLTQAGCAVLISSQNLTVLRQVADRIVIMNQGDAAGPPL